MAGIDSWLLSVSYTQYDPISHHEYFQVFAFLNNADEPYLEIADTTANRLAESNRTAAQALLDQLPQQWPVDQSELVAAKIETATANGEQNVRVTDDAVRITAANPDTAIYVVELTTASSFDTLKLVTRSIGKHPGPGRTAHGNFVLSEVKIESIAADQSATTIPIASATASAEQDGFPVTNAFDGLTNTGWAIHSGKKVPNRDRQL